MAARGRSSNGLGVAVQQPSLLLAVLWGTGGIVSALWGGSGFAPDGSPGLAVGIGALSIAIAGVLWWQRERTLPRAVWC